MKKTAAEWFVEQLLKTSNNTTQQVEKIHSQSLIQQAARVLFNKPKK